MLDAEKQQIFLSDVHWVFDGEAVYNLETFEAAVRKAQVEILGHDDDWHPEEVIVQFPELVVSFVACINDKDVEHEILLESAETVGFSTCELLFKIHNGVVELLRDDSHNYFEGLCYDKSWHEPGKPPIFLLGLGS